MTSLLHHLVLRTAERSPERIAILHKDASLTYAELAAAVTSVANGLLAAGIEPGDRVAVHVGKRPEVVASIFGISLAGGVFVPVNPLLKTEQVTHILGDCNVRCLVAPRDTVQQAWPELQQCADLRTVVELDADPGTGRTNGDGRLARVAWGDLIDAAPVGHPTRAIDADMAAIFYTSGSTGKPKGVVLSHRNMVAGAASVAEYLENDETDRILAVLPLSFDYGFSQLSTAFLSGAAAILVDYLFPNDVIVAAEKYSATGLAGVPPLWTQIAKRPWPENVVTTLRYITNSGGVMPQTTLALLREKLPETQVYLMYGLTEAFRSTYLPPAELDARPASMGKAIPNAEVRVVRDDGSECGPGEPGELVHRGALVALGYWNDPERTAKRFRPAPGQPEGLVLPEIAVWSGDTVRRDEDGYLYFVGRFDDMIKTSGYRVSPAEVESVVFGVDGVHEAVAIGVPHPVLGQGIAVVAVAESGADGSADAVLAACREHLPNFMIPGHVAWWPELPRNPNGKIDRQQIRARIEDVFQEGDA